jgi:hypothetical protein
MSAVRHRAKAPPLASPLPPKAGSRDTLPPLTKEEIAKGWTAPEKDALYRGIYIGDAHGYRCQIHGDWRRQERLADESTTAPTPPRSDDSTSLSCTRRTAARWRPARPSI